MSYLIKQDENYIVSGRLLFIILDLIGIYKDFGKIQIDENNDCTYIPIPEEKRDFLIGMLANEAENIDIHPVNNKYKQYELEKKKLQQTCKTSQEYEEKIRELIEKLGI